MPIANSRECASVQGTLTISAYGPCPDVSMTVTPDFKEAGSAILFVDMSKPGNPGRLGGEDRPAARGPRPRAAD